MSSIYIFNGKDITMNVCIQIHDVINLLQEQENIDFLEAFQRFYLSNTYETLTNVENGLWAESAQYILSRYNEEIESKRKNDLNVHFFKSFIISVLTSSGESTLIYS